MSVSEDRSAEDVEYYYSYSYTSGLEDSLGAGGAGAALEASSLGDDVGVSAGAGVGGVGVGFTASPRSWAACRGSGHSSSSSGGGSVVATLRDYGATSLMTILDNKEHFRRLGKLRGIAAGVGSDVVRGLEASQVEANRATYGENRLPPADFKNFFQLCLDALNDFILMILMVSAVVSLVLGVTIHTEDGDSAWIEGVAILTAVVIVVLVTATNDYSKEKKFRALNAEKEDKTFHVIRGDPETPQSISTFDIVVGDVLHLATGDVIPCDGIYISGSSCTCDESSVTGEPDEIHKDERKPFLRSGASIKNGDCVILVTAVGVHSSDGTLRMALRKPPADTPLQKQLDDLAKEVGKLGMAVASVLFTALMFKYFIQRVNRNEKIDNDAPSTLTGYFITCITLVVVAVPEGLPLAVTIALAYSMKKMLRDNNLVRKLSACETMGRATQICSDKTGTLTKNEMLVVDGWIAGRDLENDCKQILEFTHAAKQENNTALAEGRVPQRDPELGGPVAQALFQRLNVHGESDPACDSTLFKLVQNININSTSVEVRPKQEVDEEGEPVPDDPLHPPKLMWTGSTTEQALQTFARQLTKDTDPSMSYQQMRAEAEAEGKVKVFPFSSDRKRSSYVVRLPDGRYRWYCKGAAETVLALCSTYVTETGATAPLSEALERQLHAKISAMAGLALRALCLSYKDLGAPPADNWEEESLEGSTMLAIVGIHDVIRPDVPGAVLACQHAGITVRMCTGDNIRTAKAIGKKCNIYNPKTDMALEGPEFARLTDTELAAILPSLTVVARCQPVDKQRLVERLIKESNEVVAVTGDGTNDGPALQAAHVGFGMGITGTEVAKDASDIILMDDNFSSIVQAVKWGRNVYDSIRKFLQFQLTITVVSVALSFIGAVSNDEGESPLKAVQLLWVNLIMDTLAALALATEEPTKELLDRMPIRDEDPLISRVMWLHILGQATFQLIVSMVILYQGHHIFDVEQYGTRHFTIIFNMFVMLQLWNEHNCRRINQELNCFAGIRDVWLYIAIWFTCFFLQIVIVEAGGSWTQTTGLSVAEWAGCILIGMLSMPFGLLLRSLPIRAPEMQRLADADALANAEAGFPTPRAIPRPVSARRGG